MPTAAATLRSPGTVSPPAKMPGCPVMPCGSTTMPPSVVNAIPGTRRRNLLSVSWPSASTTASAVRVSNLPVGCGLPFASSIIRSTVSEGPTTSLMLVSHLILMPSAIASIDDQHLVGAEPPRRARRVHRCIASAIDDDAAAETRRGAGIGRTQQGDGIEHPRGIARRDLGVPADLRANRHENGIETAGVALGEEILDLVVAGDPHPQAGNAVDLARQRAARQPVGGNAEMHHAAGDRPRLADFDHVAEAGQVIRRRKPAWAGADDQHPLATRPRIHRERPALGQGEIAEKPLDGMNADGSVERLAIAGALTGMIADAAMYRRQRVVAHQRFPGGAKFPRLGEREPGLDRLARRAGIVARREQIDIDRAPRAEWTCALFEGQIDDGGQVTMLPHRRTQSAPCAGAVP